LILRGPINGGEKQIAMGKEVRILIIEDSEDDSLVVVCRLKQGCYYPDWLRVDETAEAMTDALHEETCDLVLCDYKLPGFNDLAVLEEILKNSGILYDRGDVEVCLRLFEEGRYAVVADAGPEGAC